MSTANQPNRPLRVAIIGAGPGGLTLAQILRHDERFEVTVFERGSPGADENSLVGFRIVVSPAVYDSLYARVDSQVQARLEDAVGLTAPGGIRVCLMDQYCRLKYRADTMASRSMRCISRWKLRQALLHESEKFLKFNKSFTCFEEDERAVKVHFADGEMVECDVVVGADGAGSPVRKQLLPGSTRTDSGVVIIYFKAPLTPETEAMIPWGSGGTALSPRQSMIISYFKDPKKPYGPYSLEEIDPDDSFIMVGLGCYAGEFQNQTKSPQDMTPKELKEECLTRAKYWHPLLRSLIAITVPNSVFLSYLKTQDPIAPWDTGRVTLLGDAAHSMTPYSGLGATRAIADGIALADALRAQNKPLTEQLAGYEKSMLKEGFAAAKSSMWIHHIVFAAGNTPWRARIRNLILSVADLFISHPSSVIQA